MQSSENWSNISTDISGFTVDYSNKIITAAFGIVTFSVNFVLLVYIFRLIGLSIRKRDRRSLFIHLFSICINDTLCGVAVFVIAVMYVERTISTHLCAYMIFFSIALQNVSQGNIACISVQRYVCARNINKNTQAWQSYYTKTLVAVNILVAAVTLIAHMATATIRDSSLLNTNCNMYNVVVEDVMFVLRAFFALGIPFTVISNVLCILCVFKLRQSGSVTPESNDSNTNTTSSQTEEQICVKRRQTKAITTILLILLSLNISFLPSVVGLVWKLVGKFVSADLQRAIFITMSFNSLLNPVIILGRTQSVRLLIRDDFLKMCC